MSGGIGADRSVHTVTIVSVILMISMFGLFGMFVTIYPFAMSGWDRILLLYGLPLAVWTIVLSVTDIRYGILPNPFVAGTALTGLSASFLLGASWSSILLGVILGGGTLWGLRYLSHGGMGCGDVKLGAALGCWLGAERVCLMLFLAFLAGGIVAAILLLLHHRGRKESLPFGPFLCLSACLTFLYGNEWLDLYWSCCLG